MLDFGLLLLGLIVLVFGGELLVRGAVGIAASLKISPLVIGLTIVSFGTSAPELLVSLNASLDGNSGIAIGNVLGSNIANLALVLGITCMIFPIVVAKQTKVVDWPVMMGASILFFLFALDGTIELWEGIVFLIMLIVFTVGLIAKSRKEGKKAECDELEDAPKNQWVAVGLLLAGLVGLYFGSEWFVDGAKAIAKSFGMEDHIIGLTVVAFGTSAPELVASCVAAFRQQTDISVGNLIGSNIFNILAVLGVTATVKDLSISDEVLSSDMYWMLGISLAILPMMLIGKKMGRIKGFLLFGTYVIYISLLVISAS